MAFGDSLFQLNRVANVEAPPFEAEFCFLEEVAFQVRVAVTSARGMCK